MGRMGRPTLCRRVYSMPDVTYFKPAGIPLTELQEVCLTVEEAEALRLKDLEGLEQEQGAIRMGVSRTTFGRILNVSRQKIADALLNGKSIKIEGGNFTLAVQRFACERGHEWEVPAEDAASAVSGLCPECRTENIVMLSPFKQPKGRGRQHKRAGSGIKAGR